MKTLTRTYQGFSTPMMTGQGCGRGVVATCGWPAKRCALTRLPPNPQLVNLRALYTVRVSVDTFYHNKTTKLLTELLRRFQDLLGTPTRDSESPGTCETWVRPEKQYKPRGAGMLYGLKLPSCLARDPSPAHSPVQTLQTVISFETSAEWSLLKISATTKTDLPTAPFRHDTIGYKAYSMSLVR